MRKVFVRSLQFACCLALVWIIAPTPSARATEVIFGCNGSSCGGSTVTTVSGSGIVITEDAGGPTFGDSFTFSFNTGTNTATISDITHPGQSLTGAILSSGISGGSSPILTLDVLWTLPSLIQSFLGTPMGLDSVSVHFNSSGALVSTGINIDPTPEPATLALLGSGLALMGGFLRRKRQE
jgi:hypothetical protein